MPVKNRFAELLPEITEWRRDLHEHPEILFDTIRTAGVVEGKGGHAAKQQETVDSTVVASHVVIALQSIVSRNVDPVMQCVVSVTSFETSSKAHNVIPSASICAAPSAPWMPGCATWPKSACPRSPS